MGKPLEEVVDIGGAKVRKKRPPGPDEGWAWVVAIACFTINFILAGLARSAGVLYVALIELYGASREEATTPFSIRVCVRNTIGPIVGILGQKYGIRAVTVSGGFFAGIGGALCYLAPDVVWMTFFWGLIHGVGFGLSTVIHMMTINHYFQKYRATALGMAYSGDCIGTLILPIIIEALIKSYDVKGTFLIIGGLAFNVIPLAMLLRPPPWHKVATQSKNQALKRNSVAVSICTKAHSVGKKNGTSEPTTYVNEGFLDADIADIRTDAQKCEETPKFDDKRSTEECKVPSYEEVQNEINKNSQKADAPRVPTRSEQNTGVEEAGDRDDGSPNSVSIPVMVILDKDLDSESRIRSGSACVMDGYLPPTELFTECECPDKTGPTNLIKADSNAQIIVNNAGHLDSMAASIIDYATGAGTLIKIRALSETNKVSMNSKDLSLLERSKSLSKKCLSKNASVMALYDQPKRVDSDTNDSKELSVKQVILPCIKISNEMAEDKSDIRSILTEKPSYIKCELQDPPKHDNGAGAIFKTALKANTKPIFILISMTMASYVMLFISVMTVIIDFGIDKGVAAENGKYLVIAFSAADLVGRVGFGVVLDKRWIPMHYYAAMTVGIMGLLVSLIPFGNQFLVLITCMSLFGFIQGGCAIMFPILIDKYMEKEEESIGMGCLNFYGGLLMIAIAPMIGFFRDTYESYDGMFFIVGLTTLATGLTWLLEPCILRCQEKLFAAKRTVNLQLVYDEQ